MTAVCFKFGLFICINLFSVRFICETLFWGGNSVTVLCQHHCHLSGRSSRCFMSLRTDSRTSLEDCRTQTRYHACSWMFVRTHPNLNSPRRCAADRSEKSAAGQSHGRTCTLSSAGGGAFQNELHGHTDPAERVSEAAPLLFLCPLKVPAAAFMRLFGRLCYRGE